SLPDPARLAHAPWSLCVRGGTVSLIGGRTVGGRPLTDDQGVVVQGGAQAWLVWHNTRMRVTPKAARILSADQPVPVDERWLNGLPQGPDFAAPAIPQQGQQFAGPNNTLAPAGQIFHVAAIAGTQERYYVQLPDGLSSISETQARLLLDTPGANTPREITPSAAASKPSRTNLHSRALPESPPDTARYEPQQPLCAVYQQTGKLSTDARFTIGGTVPSTSATSQGLDQVLLPGGGTFAGTLSGPGQPLQTFALITDQGLRYPVPTTDDMAKLGYASDSAVPIPANLLQLFKEGPALTTTAALRPVPAK
ncbi:type VII secretion protein EccB, partial [Actinomadura rubrisoli]